MRLYRFSSKENNINYLNFSYLGFQIKLWDLFAVLFHAQRLIFTSVSNLTHILFWVKTDFRKGFANFWKNVCAFKLEILLGNYKKKSSHEF